MRTTKTLLLASAITALSVASSVSSAAIIVNDDFEYANQAAFEAIWAPIGSQAPTSTVLDTARFKDGAKSAFVPALTTITPTGQTQSRNRRSFADIDAPGLFKQVIWSFDFYDSQANAATTGAPNRNYANLQDTTAPGSTNQLVSIGLNNNQAGSDSGGQYYMARILGYGVGAVDADGGPTELAAAQAAGTYFKLNDFATSPKRSQGWHNLKVIISSDDGLSTDYAFYVDDILAERANNVGTAASFRQFDNIAMGSGLTNGTTDASFDNMYLEVVPEPTTLAALGMLGVIGRRRRA